MWLPRAKTLLHEYVTDEKLLRHSYDVGKCMIFYARKFNQDEDLWGATGLIHDFDYQITQSCDPLDGHPYKGVRILSQLNFPAELVDAVLGHAEYTGKSRDTLLAKCLFACDEMSGFIFSCSRVHPSKQIDHLTVEFVLKRMKENSFSKAVDRNLLRKSSEELGLDFETHISNCITALSSITIP